MRGNRGGAGGAVRWAAGALAALLLAAGCQQKSDTLAEKAAPAPQAPAAPPAEPPKPFQYAAIYDCGGGHEIRVLFESRETQDARIWSNGKEMVLSMKPDADSQTYTDGDRTLSITGGGAGFDDGSGPKSCTGVSRDVPPPELAGVVRTLTIADAGQTVEIKAGESLAAALVGVPTAGYVWAPETLPDFLSKGPETSGPTSTAQFLPGFAGGNHWEVVSFKAETPGEGELVLAQRRPWEDKTDPGAQTFKVKVVAK